MSLLTPGSNEDFNRPAPVQAVATSGKIVEIKRLSAVTIQMVCWPAIQTVHVSGIRDFRIKVGDSSGLQVSLHRPAGVSKRPQLDRFGVSVALSDHSPHQKTSGDANKQGITKRNASGLVLFGITIRSI